jgi:hypothetical protein
VGAVYDRAFFLAPEASKNVGPAFFGAVNKLQTIRIPITLCRLAISQSPTADLEDPFAFSNIAVAEGCYKLAVGDG